MDERILRGGDVNVNEKGAQNFRLEIRNCLYIRSISMLCSTTEHERYNLSASPEKTWPVFSLVFSLSDGKVLIQCLDRYTC